MALFIRKFFIVGAAALFLAGCAAESQNRYSHRDVGKTNVVTFGTVLSSRTVDITGKNSGAGALVGAGIGGGAASYAGSGSGNIWAVAGGALAGAAIGAMAEQAASDRQGIEYTVTLETGLTLTIVQNMAKDERMLAAGERVMVQNSGGYQRVLPATHLPEQIAKPKGVSFSDE